MATIKPIEGKTIHQIQSGQVIVDLCSVVKELVENSLDAGAKSIEIRFKNQGLESIEVQDNGEGIAAQNYETLALKHYTSKLSTYDDLSTLQTFGFRGEALSSLCAVSRFSVITCLASDTPKGTKLDFEVSGKLKTTTVVSAQKGTIVTIENLFNNLPVRRQELERNIKREWNRVVGVLGQYACMQTGVKFLVTQQAGKGNKTTVISTKGNATTRDNLVNVFGPKAVAALIPLELKLELEPTSAPSQRWSTQDDGGTKLISITGYISRPASGQGRQTPDRQMFYVNSRPCGLPQISKAFNEVYRSYNNTQSPFIFANIELDTHMYDVNVSPDKRTILLHDQSRMLENLKTALAELFDIQDYTVPISQLPTQKQPAFKQLTISANYDATASSPSVKSARDSAADRDSSSEEDSGSREASPIIDKSQLSKKAVSKASMNAGCESINLISNWTTRNVDDRPATKKIAPSKNLVEARGGLSKDKQKLVAKFRKYNELSRTTNSDMQGSNSPAAASPSPTPSESAADSTDRSLDIAGDEDGHEREESTPSKPQSNIPSIFSPTKSAQTPSVFSTIQSPAAPRQVATIKIGDHVVTSYMGPPSAKKPRHMDFSSRAGAQEQPEASRASSSFGKAFSQRFAASTSTQQPTETSGDEDEDENPAESGNQSIGGSEEEHEVPQPKKSPEPAAEENAPVEELNTGSLTSTYDEEAGAASEEQKRMEEEAKVETMIKEAEDAGVVPSQENILRSKQFLKGVTRKKDASVVLCQTINTSVEAVGILLQAAEPYSTARTHLANEQGSEEALDSEHAEEKLSLTISKSDFASMRIIGQFNLGFILATRAAASSHDSPAASDDLFIIDQHASDEKYNFERLQATTIVQSQRLVQPKVLDLTALEEEIVFENLAVLESNGFVVAVDQSGESEVGRRCQLVSLPLSRETTFGLTDLEELIALLSEHPPGSIPRPSKVRKMFAMRACRSSIMIGKTLTDKQMAKVVQHMGEIDKPWNCPHGRPTMRHLCGLSVWDGGGWKEGDVEQGVRREPTDWAAYVKRRQAA